MKQPRKLTSKQNAYLQNRVKNLGVSASYRKAYPGQKMNPKAVSVAANRLEQDARIRLEIDKAKQAAADETILTRREALEILSTNARDREADLRDKHIAIKQLSSMEGWDAPKKSELTGANGGPIETESTFIVNFVPGKKK